MSQYLTRKRVKFLAIALSIAGLGFLHFYPPNLPEIAGQFIPYDHLATEETDPFLVGGEPPVAGSRAVVLAKRYDNVRECLVRSERDAEIPDLRKFAWHKMRSYDVADICLFRVFSSLGTPEKAKLWLDSQGLKARISISANETSVSAVNLLVENSFLLVGGSPIQRKLSMYFGSLGDDRESITSWWAEGGKLTTAFMSYNSI